MADPASSPLGRMLLDEITPVVMVLRTPLVEESCQKNGLTLVEMLSPYCVFENIDVPVRTASDQPYRLQKFKLRLFYASDVRRPNIEVAKERLEQVISHAAEKDSSALCSEPPQIETLLSTSQTELLPTWFQFFNRELVRTVSFSEHESFDHPVACLLVVSSKDEDPINKFVDLFNTNQLPSLLNDGAMDPKILKHFLLVHDNQDGTTEKATKILTQMRSTFGSNDCRLLCINSSQDELTENQDNQWTPYQKSDVSPTQRIGHFLNLDDLDELKDTMQNLSSKHIIPHMEQKIRDLNQQVSATRKGFRNQIKNLWWRKGKEDTPENPHGPTYTFSSIESQIRVLSDYAFMLRDYELALSNYRLLSTDYKLDKAWKNYAGVQEMMGLTYFMLDQSRKEAEYCMENAFNTYLRIGSSGLQNAIRCGLWWVEMLKARDQYKEAAGVYFRITGEEPLHSAVMLEQASYCYLFTKPPMLRKYGFHLVLSGDLYEKCDQIKHAIRTYRVALTVFKGATWSHIKDHVHFHVGKWFAFIGMFDVAVNHMLEVLACSQQSKSTQEQFLRDFFQIVQRAGKTFEVMRLQLPVIDIPSLKVVFEDHRTYASTEAGGVRESLWRSLEDDMLPSSSIIRTNWLDSQPKLLLKKFKESNICISGEAIKVDIGFRNPLQVPVSVSSVSLVCEHFVGTDDMLPDTDGSTNVNENDEEFKKLVSDWELSSESSPFALSEVDILLEGGETVSAHLTVTPRVEGVLKIVGVRWKLSGLVIGFCNFETNLMKRKVVKGRRKRKQSTSQNLKFLVIKSQPKLEGFIRDLPRTVYAGDLRRLTLKLRNPSEHPVKNLKMKISHPRFLNIGNREVLNMDFPSCLEKNENSSEGDSLPDTSKASTTVFLFPEDTLIHGETPFFWPLWLRGAAPGNISLYIAIYYEIGDVSSVMKYRILRMHYNLEVLPSLDVSFHISSCLSRLQEFLVRMDVVNRAGLESFQLHQLSSIGNHWEISLFQPINSIFPMEFLVAGQAFSCFFKLKNCRKSVTTEDDGSSGHDVRLHNDSKALFDIYSKPLVDFHHQERMHQETRNEGNQNMVDFILISRMQSDLTSSPKILSHHACHCSVKTASPIWWVMDGPRTLNHDFASSFCEVKLSMTIYNASDFASTIRICALDPTPSPTDETGWHDLSLPNDIKISSDVPEKRVAKSPPQEFAPPFIWSGSSSTRIKLDPMSKTDIPLDICVFSPGTFDLSNYILDWNLTGSDDGAGSSGTCRGHPYYLTVLPQD